MKETIDVNTGQVRLGRSNVILRSLAIGSCVAVAAYDSTSRTGSMAQGAPDKCSQKTRYAEEAIEEMVNPEIPGHSWSYAGGHQSPAACRSDK